MHEIRYSNCAGGYVVKSLVNDDDIGVWREKIEPIIIGSLVKTSSMGDLYWVKIIGENRDKYYVKWTHARGSFWVYKNNVIR